MQGNYTILDEKLFLTNGAKFKGRKPAKLSTYKVFYPKTINLQNSIKKQENEPNVNQEKIVNNNEINKEVTNINPINNVPNIPSDIKIENDFSKERLGNIKTKLNVSFSNSTGTNNIRLTAYRRLKVANLVVDALRKVIKISDDVKIEEKTPEIQQEVKKEQFDFSQFMNNNIENTNLKEEVVEKEPITKTLNNEVVSKPNNNEVLLDKFFKEGRTDVENDQDIGNDYIDQITALTKEKESIKESLDTQKEILANLRKKMEQNKVLVEAKKQELVEENMALTQELNDILAEINQISDITNQQEAFLGISNDNNSFTK